MVCFPQSYNWFLSSAEGEHFFLDPEAKLHKAAPPHWKDPSKGRSQMQLPTFTTYLRVKFYVANGDSLGQVPWTLVDMS